MDAVNDPSIHTVVVMKAAQIGWTEILNNVLGYFIDQDPAPVLMVQPTLEMAAAWSKDRFAPMVRDTPALTDKVADSKARDSGNTILHKTFPGGHVTMAGANSPSGLASRPIRIVLADEIDRYPPSAGAEGDPVSLARKRMATFWNRKLLMGSTPTVKGISRIEAAFDGSDQRRYWVPCPHCEESQTLKWVQVKWPEGQPEKAYYVCEHCGCEITDADKLEMFRKAEEREDCGWIAEGESNGIAGFHINELYSPWSTFASIAMAFVVDKQFPETLKTWINTALGETWEEEGDQVDDDSLLGRREDYGPEIPEGALVLTAGVDVQGDRLEIGVDAWGPSEECWAMDYRVLWGDPTQPQVWEELDALLQSDWSHELGHRLHIAATCIDSGYLTDMVYAFAGPRASRRVYATKGQDGAGRAIVSPSKVRTKNGKPIRLFNIGADEAKRILAYRLRAPPGPGYCHFPRSFDEEYFAQLTAEKRTTKYIRGHPIDVWKKTRPRNEALDIRVLNMAALKIFNPKWDALAMRTKVVALAAASNEAPPPITQRRRVRSRGIA